MIVLLINLGVHLIVMWCTFWSTAGEESARFTLILKPFLVVELLMEGVSWFAWTQYQASLL